MKPLLLLKKAQHFVKSFLFGALPASLFSRFPAQQLTIYGITGTDGKTTSNTLLYHLLKTAGYKVALISTVAAYIGDEQIDTGFHVTSPEPWSIHKLLRRCVDAGITHVVLEVTSHGIFQYRTWGIPFALGGLTNITHEHLDYFLTYEQYVKTKARLLQRSKKAFINKDDQSYPYVLPLLKQTGTVYEEYSQQLGTDAVSQAILKRFSEPYNQWNSLLVVAMAREIGIEEKKIVQAVETFPGIPGRMEEIPNNRGIKIVVDFAHTPNSLQKALESLRPQTQGKLFAVFGCAGLRDHQKRPMMGGIAAHLADVAVFTAEDPRTEDIQVIFRQMKEGVAPAEKRKVVTIADRRKALEYALQNAKKGDIIGVFGKGHEQSMCFGTVETPWSDQQVVRELLAE